MLSQSSKMLIKNHIRHVDTHNRMLEESEMWRQKDMESTVKMYAFLEELDKRKNMKEEYPKFRKGRAHMDDEKMDRQETKRQTEYEKAETNNSERWGHSGYQELYPEDFVNRTEGKNKKHRKKKEKKRKKSKSKKYSGSEEEKKDSKTNITTKPLSAKRVKTGDLDLMQKFLQDCHQAKTDLQESCEYIGVLKSSDTDKAKYQNKRSRFSSSSRSDDLTRSKLKCIESSDSDSTHKSFSGRKTKHKKLGRSRSSDSDSSDTSFVGRKTKLKKHRRSRSSDSESTDRSFSGKKTKLKKRRRSRSLESDHGGHKSRHGRRTRYNKYDDEDLEDLSSSHKKRKCERSDSVESSHDGKRLNVSRNSHGSANGKRYRSITKHSDTKQQKHRRSRSVSVTSESDLECDRSEHSDNKLDVSKWYKHKSKRKSHKKKHKR